MSGGTVAADELRLLIERIDRLEDEKKGISDDIRDVYLEAKARGYDVKIMRQIRRLRKMDPNDRREMQAILETYLAALGMDGGGGRTPDMFADHDGRPDPETPAASPGASEAERFQTALNLVVDHQNASTSWLQRQMRIGYHQASKLIEDLERHGVVSPPNHLGRRDVLVPPDGDGKLRKAVNKFAAHLEKMERDGVHVSIRTADGEVALNAPAGAGP